MLANPLLGAVKLTENTDFGNINILNMVSDLIKPEVFHFLILVGLLKS